MTISNDARNALIHDNAWITGQRSDVQGYNDDVMVRKIPDIPPEDIDAVASYLAAQATVTNPVVDRRPAAGIWQVGPVDTERDEQTGRFSVVQTLFKGSLTLGWISTLNGFNYAFERKYVWNATTVETLPTGTTGVLYRMGEPVPDRRTGAWNYWLEKRTTLDQSATDNNEDPALSDVHEDRDDGTLDIERHSGAATPLADRPFATQGLIERTENEPNEDGSWRTALRTEQSKEQEIASHATGQDYSEQELTNKGKNLVDATVALATYQLAQTAGEVQRLERAENPDGTYNIVKVRKLARSQTDDSFEERHDQASTETLVTQAASALTKPSATVGTIKRRKNRPTPFGRHETIEETVTAKDQAANSTESRHDQSSTEELNTQNATQKTGTAGVGTIVRIKNRPTPFGKFEAVKETVTAKNQGATSTSASFIERSTEALNTQGTALGGVTSSAAGSVVTIRNRPTPFGKFETVSRTEYGISREWTFTYKDRTGTVTVYAGLNCTDGQVAAKIATLSDVTNNSVHKQMNRFGLYDYAITIRPSSETISPDDWEGFGNSEVSGIKDKKGRAFLIKIVRTKSRSKAENFVNTAPGGDWFTTDSFGKYGTGPFYLGRGRWIGVRVQASKTDFGIT